MIGNTSIASISSLLFCNNKDNACGLHACLTELYHSSEKADAIARGSAGCCCGRCTPPAPPFSACQARWEALVASPLMGNGVLLVELDKSSHNLHRPPRVQEENLRNQTSSWETLRTSLGVEGSPNVGLLPVSPSHHHFPNWEGFC